MDLAHLRTPLDELRMCRLDVWDDHLQALDRARRRIDVSPGPIEIEQADPGGVSCTNRSFSLTVWS